MGRRGRLWMIGVKFSYVIIIPGITFQPLGIFSVVVFFCCFFTPIERWTQLAPPRSCAIKLGYVFMTKVGLKVAL